MIEVVYHFCFFLFFILLRASGRKLPLIFIDFGFKRGILRLYTIDEIVWNIEVKHGYDQRRKIKPAVIGRFIC